MNIKFPDLLPTKIQALQDTVTAKANVNVFVQREDLIHPDLSGNKWYKLKWNIVQAQENHFSTLLSFGGAYSNHIHALSAAGKIFGFSTIGLIRGDELVEKNLDEMNPTLIDATNNGMKLIYITRSQYRIKESPEFLESLKKQFGSFYCIPEGGNNLLGIKGCAELLRPLPDTHQTPEKIFPDVICAASGTGCTIAGLVVGLHNLNYNKKPIQNEDPGKKPVDSEILGFNVLKGSHYIETNIKKYLSYLIAEPLASNIDNCWSMNHDYHCGGYGKVSGELLDFIDWFDSRHDIPLDPVYTGKLFYAVYDLIEKKHFPPGSNIMVIHSGGLQGARGKSP